MLEQTTYALDATTIDLCLSLFPWATFRKHKGAVKLHTLLDLRGNIPTIAFITSGKVHEVNILDKLPIEAGFPYEQFYIIGAYDHRNLPLLQVHTDTDVPEENTIINNQLNLFN